MTTNDYRAKCQQLADFYAEAARTGRDIQNVCLPKKMWFTTARGPNVADDLTKWRLKPEPQKVWLVWYPSSTAPQVFLDAASAEHYASRTNGIVMEIERPEK